MNNELLNEYYLERYMLGELPDELAEKIRLQVEMSPELQAALTDFKSSNRDILALYPPSSMGARIKIRMSEAKRRRKHLSLKPILYFSSALVTIMAFFFLVLPVLRDNPGTESLRDGKDQTLVKGIPAVDLSKTQLLIFRKINDEVEMMEDRGKARAGDLLQLAYVAEESHGVIFSIDGRGSVTLHFPAKKGDSTELERHRESLLPNAIELDDAPDFERFFFVTSATQIDVNDILEKAHMLAASPSQIPLAEFVLPDDMKQYSILVLKGEGR
jgi:hypothetical protein